MKERSDNNEEYLDDDDEEIEEDEAFNSEDERKYGSFFNKKDYHSSESDGDTDNDSNVSDESNTEEDDDDSDGEGGDGGQYMLDLLSKLDGNKNNDDPKKNQMVSAITAGNANHIAESEFASSIVQKADLTLDALMDGLKDTKGFRGMQKTMKNIVKHGKTTSAPVAKVISNRAQRKVHYEDQAKEASLWLDAVQTNRQAETLDFRPNERSDVTKDAMVDKFVPTTDFEKEIHSALQKAGQKDEKSMLEAEQQLQQQMMKDEDDLGNNKLSMQEFKKRRGQLAKMRALMFYHEQKRHHIKKIKSKKYRKIRKKKREKIKEAEIEAEAAYNPDLEKELQEKEEMERMKERMTFAHKNTSKWARRILKRGRAVDVETRKALSAQLQRGDDLRKKMQYGNDAEDDSSDDGNDQNNDRLIQKAKKVLKDIDNDKPIEEKGLFKFSFMQKGIEKQKKLAQEEAKQLLREIEEEKDDYDETVESDDDTVEDLTQKLPTTKETQNMKNIINQGEIVATSLQSGNLNSIAVGGGIDIDIGLIDNGDTEDSIDVTRSNHTSCLSIPSNGKNKVNGIAPGIESTLRRKRGRGDKTDRNDDLLQRTNTNSAGNGESNPWLVSASSASKASDNKNNRTANVSKSSASLKKQKMVSVDIEGALNILDDDAGNTRNNHVEEKEGNNNKRMISQLSQDELIRKVFAAPSDSRIEEEFAIEKEKVAHEEDDTKTSRQKKKEKEMEAVAGWGSWAGDGAPKERKNKQRLPKKLQAPLKKKKKGNIRKDAKKPIAIIREKRNKNTANKYMVRDIPYPFTTREEYERSMAGSMGMEFNVTKSFKDMTRPEILTRSGKIIQPLSTKVKQTRADNSLAATASRSRSHHQRTAAKF